MVSNLKLLQTGTRASFKVDSYNEAKGTVDIVIATENEVTRRDWDGSKYIEVLACAPENVRTERLDNGNVPLVDTHSTYSVNSVFGRFVGYRFEGGEIVGTVLLSKRPEVAGIVQDVVAGVITNCSVGYEIHEAILAGERGDVPIVRIIDWEPKEVSLCAVNVDYKSGVRSDIANDYKDFQLTHTTGDTHTNNTHTQTQMSEQAKPTGAPVEETTPAPTVTPAATPPTPTPDATRAAVETAERTRVTEILSAVRAAKLDPTFADTHIANGNAIDAVRAAIITKLAETSSETAQRAQHSASVGRDLETEGRREAMTDALIMRAMPGDKTLTDERKRAAQSYRNMSLLEMARASYARVASNGNDMDKLELVKRAITASTSDFPILLDGTNRRVLLANYNIVADTWRRFCKTGSVSDFREWKRLRMGTLANLQIVGENGEFKNKKMSDADFEKISVQTWGDIINVSRQMVVNDDLGGFTDIAAAQGRAAARTIESRVYAMFAANGGNGPTMQDGNPLFHVSHGNIAAVAAAPSVTSIEAAGLLMASQMDKDKNDFLDIEMSIWLGPKPMAGDVKVINEAQFDTSVSNKFQVPNKSRGLYGEIIGTQRLSGTPWYSLAAPSLEPVFEVAFLDGNETPYMETEQGFDVDGMRWKTRLDFDCAAIGYKGIVKNAGA